MFIPPRSLRHIELHSYVPQILWHQLLINYRADFFQTCTDDQVGCLDDRKRKIFSAAIFTRVMALC
jgi:hypothetical protein